MSVRAPYRTTAISPRFTMRHAVASLKPYRAQNSGIDHASRSAKGIAGTAARGDFLRCDKEAFCDAMSCLIPDNGSAGMRRRWNDRIGGTEIAWSTRHGVTRRELRQRHRGRWCSTYWMDAIYLRENYIVTEKRAINLKRMLFASKKQRLDMRCSDCAAITRPGFFAFGPCCGSFLGELRGSNRRPMDMPRRRCGALIGRAAFQQPVEWRAILSPDLAGATNFYGTGVTVCAAPVALPPWGRG